MAKTEPHHRGNLGGRDVKKTTVKKIVAAVRRQVRRGTIPVEVPDIKLPRRSFANPPSAFSAPAAPDAPIPPGMPNAFVAALVRLREQRGWSRYRLAQESGWRRGRAAGGRGLSPQALWKLERGENRPLYSTVAVLARALGVDVSAFPAA